MDWSKNQNNFFTFVETGEGNCILIASAGSGKTTTAIEGANRIPFGDNFIFLAFGADIVKELVSKGFRNAKTFHSLGFGPVMSAIGASQLDSNKTRKIVNGLMAGRDISLYASFVYKMVSLAKQYGVGAFPELPIDDENVWTEIAKKHGIELDKEAANWNTAIQWSQQILSKSNTIDAADFDDLLYFVVLKDIPLKKYDYIFIDEAQDTNHIQREVIKRASTPKTRLLFVGDPDQAIYAFRGASSDSMELIKEEFGCVELPLNMSYRCPKKVVEFAKQWSPNIEAAPNAKEGVVDDRQYNWKVEDFKKDDLILCRTTKPLVELAFKMLATPNTITPQILGKNIGDGLIALIKKMNAKSIQEFKRKLSEWYAKEYAKAVEKMQDDLIEDLTDKYEILLFLSSNMKGFRSTVDDLIQYINSLFEEKKDRAILCTIHKAKGLEAERVYWLNKSACPSKYAKMDWQKKQEKNLCYVAATRSKNELILIEQ